MKLIAPRFQIILSVLIFPFAIVITSCSSPAVVSEKAPVRTGFDEGLRAYKKSDYGTALAKFRPLAEQGDADAQFYMGGMYATGRGVPQDYQEAVKWFRKAAEQGHAGAENSLMLPWTPG